MKKRISRGWKTIGALLLMAMLIPAFLQTPPGKKVVAFAVSGWLGRSEGMEVRIGRISGWIPGDVRVEKLEIGDAEGIWLSAENLHCRWILRELLAGRIRLRSVDAGRVVWHRLPKAGARAKDRNRNAKKASSMEIRIDGLQVDRFLLEKGVAGLSLEYAVHSGGVSLAEGLLSGGVKVGGDAEGWIDFNADSIKGPFTVLARLKQLNRPMFGMDFLSGDAEATIDASGIDASIAARLEMSGREGCVSTQLHYAERKLRLRELRFDGSGFSADGNLSLGFSKGLVDVELGCKVADAMGNNHVLYGAASVATGSGAWAVDIGSLEIRGWDVASFVLSGRIDPERMDLQGKLAAFDVGRLPLAGITNFSGKASGQVRVSGSLESPVLEIGIGLAGLSGRQEAFDELPRLDLNISGGLANGEFFAETSLTNRCSGYLSAEVALPCALAVVPAVFKPEFGKLRGRLDIDLDLDVFNGLAMLANQHVEGMLKGRLALENRIPSGFVKLEKGSYEHYDWGVLFHGCEAELEAMPDGFVFRRASATDGADGRLALSGGLGGGLLDLQLELAKAKVLRRPEIEATMSGLLKISGGFSRPEVNGKLVIDRADILPDNMVPAHPPLLASFDLRSKTNLAQVVRRKKTVPFGMDVRVEMPDRIHVNASLIESMWGGVLVLKDGPDGISAKGTLEPRRGFVDFLGKKFRFQSGEIVLDGSVPTMPVFNGLTAEYARSDITARLVLNGKLNAPQYQLESTPAMPDDEILAHVLFNRDSSSISSYQAYRIAAAARQLSGGLNGPGFMYQFRQVAGIDTLEWREPDMDGESSSVAAGKYLTPELYVEINSTFGRESQTGMMAEFEINRHFSLETSVGPKMRPGIGVNWKYDY